jgi:hypothetical protein
LGPGLGGGPKDGARVVGSPVSSALSSRDSTPNRILGRVTALFFLRTFLSLKREHIRRMGLDSIVSILLVEKGQAIFGI